VEAFFDVLLDEDYTDDDFLCLIDSENTDHMLKDYYNNDVHSPGKEKFFIRVCQLQKARSIRLATAALGAGAGAGASGCASHVQARSDFPPPEDRPVPSAAGRYVHKAQLRPKTDLK
jgi:hypothetical protein